MADTERDKNLAERIAVLAREYTALPSDTNTALEEDVAPFFERWFESVPYFREHPEHRGLHPIPGDPLRRQVAWAMVRGPGKAAVVLIHHSDTADILDYGPYRYSARDVDAITSELRAAAVAPDERGIELSEDAKADLRSGDWLFGRGLCDMKGGGAVQMALLEEYAAAEDRPGTVIMLALPDEENLSAGMRAALGLLSRLKDEHGLDYRLMIDTEPHDRDDPKTPVLHAGSVGKLMPVVYAKGAAAHAGQVFNGLNPAALLSAIVARTELDPAFVESVVGEAPTPPTWLCAKDRKSGYDVSLPLSAAGYLSVLFFERSVRATLDLVEAAAREAFDAFIARMNDSYATYRKAKGLAPKGLPWKTDVRTFDRLKADAERRAGPDFKRAYGTRLEELEGELKTGRIDMAEATFRLIETTIGLAGVDAPIVVIALSPPFYPSASTDPAILDAVLGEARRRGSGCRVVRYMTGISDLSYGSGSPDERLESLMRGVMPLWGGAYVVPFADMARVSMPTVNIGPWGKDFHKLGERVYAPDLYGLTPALTRAAIENALR